MVIVPMERIQSRDEIKSRAVLPIATPGGNINPRFAQNRIYVINKPQANRRRKQAVTFTLGSEATGNGKC